MKRKLIRASLIASALAVTLFTAAVLLAGSLLSAPHRQRVGELPAYLKGEGVKIESQSGATLAGWFVPGKPGAGAVVLMHGVRGTRTQMLGHADFLSRAGYSLLLFDFQAHGESAGEQITFGHLESRDAQAAVNYVRRRLPGEKVGVIGVSLGGAAALLASPELDADALVVEMVYSNIHRAIANRLAMNLGGWAEVMTPLLCRQLKPRLGVDEHELCPAERVREVTSPLFVIGCAEDRHTKLEETRQLFDAAREPKQLWVIEGAAHVDPHTVAKEEYERRVLEFFARHLREFPKS
jgi:uncharacterized protein